MNSQSQYPIDHNTVRTIIRQLVERWAGAPLDARERDLLERFMEEEVKPLDRLALLERMGTPADTIHWFMDYIDARIQQQVCQTATDPGDVCLCCAC